MAEASEIVSNQRQNKSSSVDRAKLSATIQKNLTKLNKPTTIKVSTITNKDEHSSASSEASDLNKKVFRCSTIEFTSMLADFICLCL